MEGVVYLICWTSILWMFSWWVTLLIAAWNEDKDFLIAMGASFAYAMCAVLFSMYIIQFANETIVGGLESMWMQRYWISLVFSGIFVVEVIRPIGKYVRKEYPYMNNPFFNTSSNVILFPIGLAGVINSLILIHL